MCPTLSDYEDEEELEIDRLLGEPTYLPLKRLPSREAPDDFVRARRRREQGPHDDGADAGGAASSSFALWCQDVAHDFVLGVTIPIPETEVEWKKILKNPSKFISKSVLKGAEVSWHKLSATQRKAMSEAKQLEVDQWIVRKVVEKFRGHIPTDRLMKTRWVLTFKAIEGDEKNVKAKARIVLLGFTDPDLGDLETCAPTLTRQERLPSRRTFPKQEGHLCDSSSGAGAAAWHSARHWSKATSSSIWFGVCSEGMVWRSGSSDSRSVPDAKASYRPLRVDLAGCGERPTNDGWIHRGTCR